MKVRLIALSLVLSAAAGADTKTLYENNFEKTEVGQVPSDFLVLDGGFVVKQEDGNKFLELPGAPLDNFAIQFGPVETENVAVSARIKGIAQGRRYPLFGVGLNGVAGYKLQITPAKKQLELYKDQDLKAAIPYDWKSGQWTRLRLQVRKVQEGHWKIEGRAWAADAAEPGTWPISIEGQESPTGGRASVFGSPFSGKPIQFDDLVVSTAS